MKTIDLDKLLESLQRIAELAIYKCDRAGPDRVVVPSEIVDYFQSDEFMVVGMLKRGEAQIEEVHELIKQTRDMDAQMRELRIKIIKLEETEGLYREVCSINAKLLDRIEDLER